MNNKEGLNRILHHLRSLNYKERYDGRRLVVSKEFKNCDTCYSTEIYFSQLGFEGDMSCYIYEHLNEQEISSVCINFKCGEDWIVRFTDLMEKSLFDHNGK